VIAPAAQLLLAMDTATRRASVALCRGEELLGEDIQEVTTHSEGLIALIDRVLRSAGHTVHEVEAVVCGRGPGSFTGLRIGLATAKGLCLAAGKPLVCVSSLLPLALAAAETTAEESSIVALLDARRGEVYAGLFCGGEPRGEEVVCRPENLADWLPPEGPLLLVGDGALAYRGELGALLGDRATLAPGACHVIEARHLARAAWPRLAASDLEDVHRAAPRYIRPSDARLPATPQTRRERSEP
jgi:tRNA threonylcarbamoyladenosine biosynthesis protein TsaB